MPYTVEITLADPPPVDGGDDLPIYQLPETFDTVADAKEAAAGHIAGLERHPATVLFTVMDQEGVTVLTGDGSGPTASRIGNSRGAA